MVLRCKRIAHMTCCIICREEQDSFSDEHVIPDALGGYYHVYTVCKSCNSNLGSFIDSKLINHQLTQFQRYILELKGKSKKLPNPFAGNHHFDDHDGYRVQLRLDDNNNPIPYIIPKVSYEEINDGRGTKVSIILDGSDADKLDGILDKITQKYQIDIDQIENINRTRRTLEEPRIKCNLSVDLKKFKIGLLKIAYEFAVDTIPEYFSDQSAINISQILKKADYESALTYVNVGDGFNKNLYEPFAKIIDLGSKKHYLVLADSDQHGLICFIHIHRLFSAGVLLSETTGYQSEMLPVFGVNDLDNKSFKKVFPEDLLRTIYSVPELRLAYHFDSNQSAQEFFHLESSENFNLYMKDNNYLLFDRSGKPLQFNIQEEMMAVENLVTTEDLEGGGFANVFPFLKEFYVKMVQSNKLIQVVGVREEYRQIAKL